MPVAPQPPTMGEQETATPERPAIEIRAQRLLEPIGRLAFVLGKDSTGMAEIDRDPLGWLIAHDCLDLGEPLAGELQVTGMRRGLREVADGHAGEIRMMGWIAGIEQSSGESQRFGMVTERER